MATLLLSVAGAAIGGSFGGSVAGLAGGAIGKAAGATVGAIIDARLTGLGSAPVETGRVERFRVMGASEGAALPRVFGRYRVAGQVIWSSNFLERVNSTRVGGKGGGQQSQTVREFSYSISLAIAVCEGEVARIGRIWADGQRLNLSGITWRLHDGSDDQLPDPIIAAIEGEDATPAYRGTAYVVFENLDLTPFGNRIPQFNFEVVRRPREAIAGLPRPPALDIRGVALVPGTGEYALATVPVHINRSKGDTIAANVNNDRGRPDFLVSLEQLQAELPAAKSVSLVVSWFGDDLRCDRCTLRPAVEQADKDGQQMPWRVSGIGRSGAKVVSVNDGRPVFGGTPADASVVQAINHLRQSGQSVMFYPFILMDILAENVLLDPWTGEGGQSAVPWRGRITLSQAPGRDGSPDKTTAAAAEVASFFGTARITDFRVQDGEVIFDGPAEHSYRRFVLHYAHLCALAGGVEAFCIGSEMRSLTQIRDSAESYPAVRALCELAQDVRAILGEVVKIGYAADWSEYFGHHPEDGSGDILFNLDPLWAHPAINFIGIDNYMPLSDWRDGSSNADAAAGSIYDLDYLIGNVAGGEGFDWYYANESDRESQFRSPISDRDYAEDWLFRYKDIANWWSNSHINRIAGVKVGSPTAWQPRSKPIWFTELGCPAVDKGTNQPNVFFDPKSSESFFPYFSNGSSDEFIQYRYLQAVYGYWTDPANNPLSDRYAGRMIDMERAHIWAWDARPWPDFPELLDTWIDGLNYQLGHWINGRAGLPSLAEVVAEIASRSSDATIDVSDLHGRVTGFTIGAVETARQSLQPLMLAYGFDSFSLDGRVVYASRAGNVTAEVAINDLAASPSVPNFAATRGSSTDAPGCVAIEFVRADMDYQPGVAEAVAPQAAEPEASRSSVALVLSEGRAKSIADRWLRESAIARDSIQFALSPTRLSISAGDIFRLTGTSRSDLYRVDRVEEFGQRALTAVRCEAGLFDIPVPEVAPVGAVRSPALTPVHVEFADLPLLSGDENPTAPSIAVVKTPWAGPVAVYSAADDFGYVLNSEIFRPATLGETLEPLSMAAAGLWNQSTLRVRLISGLLQSRARMDVLNGANAAAVRFGADSDWEVLQFASATLVAPNEYILNGFLRGQAGTDGIAPDIWPAGSDFLLLDAGVVQLGQSAGSRGLERHYRIGPSTRGYDDQSYVHFVEAFSGVGLRPYSPAHFTASRHTDGAILLTWVRRTRVDGDSWEGSDAPLGEDRELYHLKIYQDGSLLREYHPEVPVQIYSVEDQAKDGFGGNMSAQVSQISSVYGAGPYRRLEMKSS